MPAGGARPGAGRKSRQEELQLLEKLTPLEPAALKALEKGIAKGEFPFIKMFFEYYVGKPKENIEVDHSGEVSNNIGLDVSKLSDAAIRELLNARRRESTTDGASEA